jgi:hypothetical protein
MYFNSHTSNVLPLTRPHPCIRALDISVAVVEMSGFLRILLIAVLVHFPLRNVVGVVYLRNIVGVVYLMNIVGVVYLMNIVGVVHLMNIVGVMHLMNIVGVVHLGEVVIALCVFIYYCRGCLLALCTWGILLVQQRCTIILRQICSNFEYNCSLFSY